MPDLMTITYRDWSDEEASFSLRVPTLTAANFDAQDTLRDALSVDILALTLGIEARRAVAKVDAVSGTTPASAVAQRESKWLITYLGANGKTYRCEIPTPDLTVSTLMVSGTDIADLTQTPWTDFITSFEAAVVDEAGGAVTVEAARFVGRNT